MIRHTKTLFLSGLFAASILLGGCVASINKSPPARVGTTLGQELIDLDRARDVGALSEAEYGAHLARLMGGSDSSTSPELSRFPD